jgi:hypothetical protein
MKTGHDVGLVVHMQAKILGSSWKNKIYYCIHNSATPVLIWFHSDPVPNYFLKVHFNIILSLGLGFQSNLFIQISELISSFRFPK